jgi:aminoglycoside/choline kinase family phosphotransferase
MASPKSDKAVLQRRQAKLQNWFTELLPDLDEPANKAKIAALSGDASFRRYFTARPSDTTYVLVDAPPDKENCYAFVQIAEKFEAAGVNVPHVHSVDYALGFMCLSYLGDTLLNSQLQELRKNERLKEVHDVYNHAFDILIKIQLIHEDSDILLPPYDGGLLMRELELFRDWFCGGIMELSLSKADEDLLDHFFGMLIDAAQAQPQVCVHRDYHSRNLMYQEDGNFGVLDFQDAVIGPVTYDLVSLIKDCYISWSKSMIRDLALQYANMAHAAGVIDEFNEAEFLRSFDLMGVQRHLKAIGIFSRLYLRDGKPGYLNDIPRTLAYVKEVLSDYPDLYGLDRWFEHNIYPLLWTRLKNITNRAQQS